MNWFSLEQCWDLLGQRETARRCQKKNKFFRMKLVFRLVGKLIGKITVFGTQKTHNVHITRHCIVRLVERRHHWLIFLWKWEPGNFYSQWRHLSQNDNQSFCTRFSFYWCERYLVSTGWCNLSHISCQNRYIASNVWWSKWSDVNWPPRICDLTPLDYFLSGVVEEKSYPNKQLSIWRPIFLIQLPRYDPLHSKKMHENVCYRSTMRLIAAGIWIKLYSVSKRNNYTSQQKKLILQNFKQFWYYRVFKFKYLNDPPFTFNHRHTNNISWIY